MKDKLSREFGPMEPNLPPELKKRAHYNRTSYFCCINDCPNCDEVIKYDFEWEKKTEIFNATTRQMEVEVKKIKIHWNPQQNGQILAGGELQDPENTPPGTKCECFCHVETRRHNMMENNPESAKVLSDDTVQSLK